jgi:tetratricopeptide (TPR) repeat protein
VNQNSSSDGKQTEQSSPLATNNHLNQQHTDSLEAYPTEIENDQSAVASLPADDSLTQDEQVTSPPTPIAYGQPLEAPALHLRYTRPVKPPSRIARPLPHWLLIAGIILTVVGMIIFHLTGSDWAAGALNAAHAALVLGVLLVVAFIIRSSAGLHSSLNPTRNRQRIFSLVAILLVFCYAFVAQALQSPLHIEQGKAFEHQQQWQQAINEYTMGGESAPTSVDLARVYTSWGLQLNQQHQYDEASQQFNVVITQFDNPATITELHRAQDGDITARIALAQQDMQKKNYSAATNDYDAILHLSYCSSTCTTQTTHLDATAYLDLGKSDLQAKNYNIAVDAFDYLLAHFPKGTPEIQQSHGYEAQALMGYGQQERVSDCPVAIPIYQRLATTFSDTSDGKQAKSALSAPQTVTGTFANVESDVAYTYMGLAQGLTPSSGDDLFNQWYDAYMTTTMDSNGNFTFTNVQQGNYDLIWYANNGIEENVEYMYYKEDASPVYIAHVGPLCPVHMGDVTNALTKTESL